MYFFLNYIIWEFRGWICARPNYNFCACSLKNLLYTNRLILQIVASQPIQVLSSLLPFWWHRHSSKFHPTGGFLRTYSDHLADFAPFEPKYTVKRNWISPIIRSLLSVCSSEWRLCTNNLKNWQNKFVLSNLLSTNWHKFIPLCLPN